ncbi:hypothetical protein [Streptomyces agglomeratus]|uniref:hypothetical protein n=1 Tax=Streptomyces agglomeratus TaxID=285458 RepID=UPI001F0AF9B4|nr:hypothetical protein [Streptomyces agglomeratus]
MAFGAAGASARRIRYPSTSTPRTVSDSLKSEGSTTSISRNRTSAGPGTGLVPRCSRSLSEYSARSPACRRLAMMLIELSWARVSVMNRRAAGSNDAVGAQFGGARDPGDQRHGDDACDEHAGDGDAVGLVDDVGDQGVEQHRGERGESRGGDPLVPAKGGDGDGEGTGDHHGQDAGGVGAGLGVDVGVERDGDDDAQRGVDEYDGAYGASPLGGHAVVGQVAGTMLTSRHRGRAANHRIRMVLMS